MSPPRAPIPVLRFHAGPVPCAVAARAVRRLGASIPGSLRLGDFLRLPAATHADDHSPGQWLLRLDHQGRSADVVVEGPVALEDVAPGHILPRPRLLPLARKDLVLGFALCRDEVVVLLDIPTLVDLARTRGN